MFGFKTWRKFKRRTKKYGKAIQKIEKINQISLLNKLKATEIDQIPVKINKRPTDTET